MRLFYVVLENRWELLQTTSGVLVPRVVKSIVEVHDNDGADKAITAARNHAAKMMEVDLKHIRVTSVNPCDADFIVTT